MARPQNKEQLLAQSEDNFERLLALIDPLSEKEKAQSGVNGEWSVKDVLAHLAAWHALFFTWYEIGQSGEKPEMPAPGYTWKTTPALNEKIFQEHRDDEYEDVVAELRASHKRLMKLISNHSDEELFTKQKYAWTGSSSLGVYIRGSASSHYQWAIDLIRKWLKSRTTK